MDITAFVDRVLSNIMTLVEEEAGAQCAGLDTLELLKCLHNNRKNRSEYIGKERTIALFSLFSLFICLLLLLLCDYIHGIYFYI